MSTERDMLVIAQKARVASLEAALAFFVEQEDEWGAKNTREDLLEASSLARLVTKAPPPWLRRA